MNPTEFFEINKLSQLHNGKTIFFCKTDYLDIDFKIISKLNNDIVLISGNSDYHIDESIINKSPKNIIKWFAQNALSNNDILEPIPIGLENEIFSTRNGHGVGWGDRVKEKKQLIYVNRKKNIYPQKFIYANFNIATNINYRLPIKNILQKLDYVTWKNPELTLLEFYNDIYNHKMVLCPIGNGVDTHRLWETLYCNRVPITIKIGNFKIYDLYKKLPIIILDSLEEILDKQHIITLYKKTINKNYDYSLLDYSYWKEKIINSIEK